MKRPFDKLRDLTLLLVKKGLYHFKDLTLGGLKVVVDDGAVELTLGKLGLPLGLGHSVFDFLHRVCTALDKDREKLYAAFRNGTQKNLMVSKVGNFAIDLPDANVLIQISGTFGSRQEEAQRLGRVLRPKSDGGAAHFYSIVTQDSKEQEFAMNRQLFLTEQGYAYKIIKRGDWDILARTPEELAARAKA